MAQSLDETNVFVKYLPAEIDDDGLRELFSTYGPIVSSKVMVDHQTKTSLGYGFVRFTSSENTQKAIQGLSGYRINNKVLLCKLSNSSPNVITPEFSTNLYIKPLLSSTTEESLRAMFSEFGPIAAVKVMVDKNTGESRQIGFVRYESQEDATSALNAMNGRKISDELPALIVKYAETELQRAARKTRSQGPSPSSHSSNSYSSSSYSYTSSSSPSPSYSSSSGPSSPSYSPPSSPRGYDSGTSSPVYYPPPQMAVYSYMPVPIGHYNNYMTMLSYPSQSTPYNPLWRPPYVLSAEQMLSY